MLKTNFVIAIILSAVLSSCVQKKDNGIVNSNENQQIDKPMEKQEYFFSKTVEMDFDTVIATLITKLQEEKFGLIDDMDMQAKLIEKLGAENVDIKRYRMLGFCNPGLAKKAIKAEPKIGNLLPCKVVVRELEDGKVEISSINPEALMSSFGNEGLNEVAKIVSVSFDNVISSF